MMMRTIRSASSFRAEYRNGPAAVAGIGEMEAGYAGYIASDWRVSMSFRTR
jgi:hypothetical protein